MFTALRESGGAVLQVPNNLFFQKIFRVADGSQYLFEALEQGGLASEPDELRSAREPAGARASGGRPYS
jgi:hypothetical protein